MKQALSSIAAFITIGIASTTSAAPAIALTVPPDARQRGIAVRVEATGVRVHTCAAAPCTPDGGIVVTPPADPRATAATAPAVRAAEAKASTITLEGGRVVVRVDVPGEAPGSAWVLLAAGPLTGHGDDPAIVWSGWIGAPRGELGEEHSADVVVEPRASGGSRVLVGERRADVTLCGRPTLVAAREIDPATLELARGASVQNLSEAERTRAVKITAERSKEPAPPASPARALHATAASSAFEKKLSALTDGDPATAWSENKAGDGRGEFVSMSAPEELGITAFDLVVRPTADVPDAAAPKRFFLATSDALFEVTMPEDALRQPAGTHYTIKLPAEIHASCLALVLEDAYGRANPRVTIAELTARTAFDGASPSSLATSLAGGGDRARAAAALLVRSGPPGVAAAIGAYEKLDEAGRRLAESVVDAAPCSEQVPFFAARFAASSATGRPKPAPGDIDPELAHARDRLRRCGHASAAPLAKLVAEGSARTRVLAADELAALAPAEAVTAILDALAAADDPTRRDLRAALARAAKSARAQSALHDELAKPRLAARSETVAIDLLRAIGPSLGSIEGARDAFVDVAARASSFRGRYLLQAPAAELAIAGDARAADYLRRSLREDQDAHVRTRAAEAAGAVPALAAVLVDALADTDPRVREAALNAVADASLHAKLDPRARVALRERLARDDWTFVRAGAARTLGALPADAEIDRALADALADGSPDVRGRAIDGLGEHRAIAHADAVRERQNDTSEGIEVRARAILALGAMCDARSLDDWTKLARAAKQPADDNDRRLGGAAIAALGQVHPPDLEARLAPLTASNTPPAARELARSALSGRGGCR